MWQSGVGGSIPSMVAYVLGAVGIFRLVRERAQFDSASRDGRARCAAWMAALIYAANPNLIYLQATAMTEPLYLALFIWAVVYFTRVRAGVGKPPMVRLRPAAPSALVNADCAWPPRA